MDIGTPSAVKHDMTKINKLISKHPLEKHFNKISRYHYWYFLFLFMLKLFSMWHVLNVIFLTPPTDFYCKGKKNACPCENPEWNKSVFTATMQTKYTLCCEREWLITFSNTMMYLGALVGAFLFGVLSDEFGRLIMLTISTLIMGLFGCLFKFMPTIGSCIIVRVMEGVGFGGSVVTSYVMCVEFCGVRHREMVSVLYHIPFIIGYWLIAGVSYFLRDCDDFQLAISLPLFMVVPMKLYFQESPKWLMDSGQVDKTISVMQKVCHFNGTPFAPIKTEIQEYRDKRGLCEKINIFHIFSYSRITTNFACMTFNYYVFGTGYYGITQLIGYMSQDIYVNVALSGALLLLGTIISGFLLHLLSRRTFLMTTNFTSGTIMLIIIYIPPNHVWPRVILAGISNTCFFMSFILIFLYGVELFPTAIRSSVFGFLYLMSRAGQMTAPAINLLSPVKSGALFGTLAILAGLVCIPLPETKHIELPSSLEESEALRGTWEEDM